MRFRFIIVAAMVLIGESVARVAPTTLQQLAAHADLIVIGKVTRVIEVKGIWVAQVQVSSTVKGEPHSTVYYLAQPTWVCDMTTATAGEEALFFLDRYEFDPHPASTLFVHPEKQSGSYAVQQGSPPLGSFKEPLGFREQITALTGAGQFWQLSWSGRGRMPIRVVKGKQYVNLWTADVRLPATIPTIDGPEKKYRAFIRSAPLSSVLDFVRNALTR